MRNIPKIGFEVLREYGVGTTSQMATNYFTVRYRQKRNQLMNRLNTESIYEEDWDLLIIIDACRYDLLADHDADYEFLEDVQTYRSAGSQSREWMINTFGPEYSEEMANTSYISANPFTDAELNSNDFQLLDEVWRDGWDVDLQTVHPRVVTDRAVNAGRETDSDRYIVHYMQPHLPLVEDHSYEEISETENPAETWGDDIFGNLWRQVEMGVRERAEVWDIYERNLDVVLSEVSQLLDNFDGEDAVITSDHGNAVGEKRVYGHPMYLNLDCLRTVPWIETTATDTDQYTVRDLGKQSDTTVEERLSDLGYV